MNIEELGIDSSGKVSSQSTIKYGKNRGRRKAEKRGAWIYSNGFCYDDCQETKGVHSGWIKAIQQLGYRVGSHDYDGVRSYFIFKENQ